MCVLVFARYGARLGAAALVRQIPVESAGRRVRARDRDAGGVRAPSRRRAPLGAWRWRVRDGRGTAAGVRRVGVQFMAMPLITLAAGRLLGLGDAALTVALLFQALPTSSASWRASSAAMR